MKTETEVQNFVREFKDDDENSFWDYVHAPCMMLLCNSENGFRYCHFDENNLDELKSFVDYAYKNGSRKIGLFGGWGSDNISELIKYLNHKGMQKLTQKDFVDFSSLEEIEVHGSRFYFFGQSPKRKEYSFSELRNFLS